MSTLKSTSMKALALLKNNDAPRVFSPTSLKEYFKENALEVSRPSITLYMQSWNDGSFIKKVKHGVYLNLRATPEPSLEEAAPWVREGAIVSLQTVLGQSGVLNNPTDWVTCVYAHSKNPNNLNLECEGGTFKFTSINDKALPSPDEDWYKEAYEPYSSNLTATPEKALLDWIYLGTHAYQWSLPPAHDIDWEELNEERLNLLADKMGLKEALVEFKKSVNSAEQSYQTYLSPLKNH